MMHINRFAIHLALGAAAYLGNIGIAAACGCTSSRSFSMSSDQTNVYATASMTITYLCQGETTATITAPNATQTYGDSGVLAGGADPIVANDNYQIGIQDGTYQGTGTYYYDGADVGYGTGYFQPQYAAKTVTPYVQLVRTDWSGNIRPVANGSATFTVVARTSSGCSGNVIMEAGMTRPTNAQVSWTDTNGLTTEDIEHPFPGGSEFTYTFAAGTSTSNAIIGTVTGRLDKQLSR